MRERNVILPLLLVLTLVAFVGGCKKKPIGTVPAPPPIAKATPPPPPPKTEVKDDFKTERFPKEEVQRKDVHYWNSQQVLKTVYFAFDSADLTPTTQATLRENATWLKAHTEYRVLIQGHCDERGTIEYNLALGDRRAGAVRDYLASLGVDRSRARVVSYGEERPAVQGHDESAWSRNRRAESLLEE